MIRWQSHRSLSVSALVVALKTVLLLLGRCGSGPTIEDMYQLTPLGAAAATPPVTGIWAP